jgi:hypothetical protein
MKEYLNVTLFVVICFTGYLLINHLYYNPMLIEGMRDASGEINVNSSTIGVADNAASYAASLKAATIKLQDELLISKYRSDYESAIINLDDLINNLMLNTALNVNQSDPTASIEKLAKMQQAKVALNSIMKFVDSQ